MRAADRAAFEVRVISTLCGSIDDALIWIYNIAEIYIEKCLLSVKDQFESALNKFVLMTRKQDQRTQRFIQLVYENHLPDKNSSSFTPST